MVASYSKPHVLHAALAPINRADNLRTFERIVLSTVKLMQGRTFSVEQLYSACPVALAFESFQFRVPEIPAAQAWWNQLPDANCTDGIVTTSFRSVHQLISSYGTEPIQTGIRQLLYEILPEVFFKPSASDSMHFRRADKPSKAPNIIFSFLVPETARFSQMMTQLRIASVQASFQVVDSAERMLQVPIDWSCEPRFQPNFGASDEEQQLQELWSSLQEATQEFNRNLYNLPSLNRELSPVTSTLMSRVYAVGSLRQWTRFMIALIRHPAYYVKDLITDMRSALDSLQLPRRAAVEASVD